MMNRVCAVHQTATGTGKGKGEMFIYPEYELDILGSFA
jgi:hypothetical protein